LARHDKKKKDPFQYKNKARLDILQEKTLAIST
jgi:hypothetical protein